MDRVTKSLLSEFSETNDLTKLEESKQFEHFSSYLVTSKLFTDSFSTHDIVIGNGGDLGIDGISIIANGCFITEPEEIDELIETNGFLDVAFILVQSETSSSFDTAKIGQFGFGSLDFFSEKSSLVKNEDVENKKIIVDKIYNQSGKFKHGNPNCHLFYVTTGKWQNDTNIMARMESVKTDLKDLQIFKEVKFECIDAKTIHQLYRDSKNSLSREIIFSDKIVLPEILNIQEAYIGVISVKAYLKLIQNEDGEIIRSLFYDNIRHWQGWNSVNTEIKDTLNDPMKQIYLPLFNNGITIVARSIKPTGNKLLLEDYQIVNGCQTSYVLYEIRDSIADDALIPIRLIATSNQEVKNSIIKATNRQTQVDNEQLLALTDFPKRLEDFFNAFTVERRLYYERRSRQYNEILGIEKVRIINMTTLVRAFASFFLDLPHRTTRNYKALLKNIGSEIFNASHKLEAYYVAAFASYKLEYLFRVQQIDRKLKPARYHILMCFRYLASQSSNYPQLNSNEMERYCNSLMDILWDDNKNREIFTLSEEIVTKIANGDFHRDNIRTEPFTEKVIALLKSSYLKT